MNYAVAVIDIGMTNKKVAVYDENLHQLDAVYKNFEPLKVKDPTEGVEVDAHDLAGMEDWFCEQLRAFAQKYPIKALSITTHGATFVCIDGKGKVCAPCVFYTHEPGESFQKDFYTLCGTKEELQKTTYTPPFGSLINPAKGIMYMQKHFPGEFAKTKTILNFPQYWGYVFTGIAGIEPTYCGCHSYLWNHKKSDWSPVADTLNIRSMLPVNYKNTCEALGTLSEETAKRTGLDKSVIVTMGIHDSNASLLPYLAKNDTGDFVLNSTGTWCVCMHPQDSLDFNDEDIGKIVFFNQSAFRQPVKTSIFLGGMEFDTYISLYKKVNKTDVFPSFGFDETQAVLNEKDTFLMPEMVAGSGQFTGSKPGIWEKGKFYSLEAMQNGSELPEIVRNEKRFFALLDLSLVIQTETALRRAGLKKGTKVFTEGGFRKNKLYNALLAAAMSENEFFLTSIAEATACGAAMTAIMALSGKQIAELGEAADISYQAVDKAPVSGYEEYKKAWEKLI
ncbi:MAG: FGGY family carbohydrate kinase [Treponema sp.]|uniref:FGGY family carbohydrate kinase n=1 Tax=Treponema sp. TaxID=166 RepID=UPI003FA28472